MTAAVGARKLFKADAGVVHALLQARYYDGSKGEFLSEDPVFLGDPRQQVLTDPQSLNSYSYANDNPIIKSDPTGRIAGVDDLIAFGVGGVVNFSGYTVTSAMTGQRMTWGGAANAFVTGGIVGVGIDNAPETAGLSVEAALLAVRSAAKVGALAGGAGNLTQQVVNVGTGGQTKFDWGAVAFSPVQGAFNTALMEGALGNACVPGLSCGSGNMYATGKSLATKLSNGTIGSISASSAFKSAVGAQTAGLYKTFSGSLFDSVASSRSSGSSQGSGSSGGNAVGSWMGALNPFQPH
jgi:RHS repeat-associated protein